MLIGQQASEILICAQATEALKVTAPDLVKSGVMYEIKINVSWGFRVSWPAGRRWRC